VFFSNRRPGYLERYGLTAEELSEQRPGLIHAKVVLHGEKGPWSNRVGFDEIGAAVSGLFSIEGSPTQPKSPAIIPICDNVVGWLGTAGSKDEHTYVAPDLFTAETPLGTYQGFTDQVVLSRTPGAFRTVLVPRGSSKPEWPA
jgi:CoA-transferase family III